MDWKPLLQRLGDDAMLLGGLLSLFRWACPGRARQFPDWIWDEVGLASITPEPALDVDRRRIDNLDSRDWFGPTEADACLLER